MSLLGVFPMNKITGVRIGVVCRCCEKSKQSCIECLEERVLIEKEEENSDGQYKSRLEKELRRLTRE